MQKPMLTRIVAAVVDTRQLTLYKQDGTTITIPQGDARVRRVIDQATPQIIQQGYADVDLTNENAYKQFEEKSGGGIRLFRIAKEKLKGLFGKKEEEEEIVDPVTVGKLPTAETVMQKTLNAVDEILANATPVSDPDFHENTVSQQAPITEEDGSTPSRPSEDNASDTIVAVVDGKIIPGMEKIKTQFGRAAKLGSTKGVENFLKRISKVIEKRSHSIEDLLKFMERGDLPIADDGTILIYKVLNNKHGYPGVFVDCHTRNVTQRVGSYVCMDERLVDHNRNNECSNGLHVARRGYINGFNGDVCVIAKLAPEDVIAVPTYDANKMRVCGYHIIFKLPNDLFNELKRNRPITSVAEGQQLLARALKGDHIGRIEEVRIHAERGGGLKITSLGETSNLPRKSPETSEKATALENPANEMRDHPVNPKEIAKQVEGMSRKDAAAKLHAAYKADPNDTNKDALKAFKRAAKVSWDTLGVPDPDVIVKPAKKAKAKSKPKTPVTNKMPKAKARKRAGKAPAAILAPPVPIPPPPAPEPVDGPKARVTELLKLLNKEPKAPGVAHNLAQQIANIKKSSKKSWSVLGVDEAALTTIKEILG